MIFYQIITNLQYKEVNKTNRRRYITNKQRLTTPIPFDNKFKKVLSHECLHRYNHSNEERVSGSKKKFQALKSSSWVAMFAKRLLQKAVHHHQVWYSGEPHLTITFLPLLYFELFFYLQYHFVIFDFTYIVMIMVFNFQWKRPEFAETHSVIFSLKLYSYDISCIH